ncbi:MAG: glycosyltransferase [Endomicrobiales bacterium]|nr:glycosyltransferase [Endomicrobiales bacterium]
MKASICVPVFNQAKYIESALNSALKQDYDDFEIVVSENWSTDDTPEILKRYDDSRIKLHKPERHLNMAENWNYCISKSRGEYINLLSGDDTLAAEFLKEQAAVLDGNEEVLFTSSGVNIINESGTITGRYFPRLKKGVNKGKEVYGQYVDSNRSSLISTLFRRKAYERTGGFPGKYKICLDWLVWLRMLKSGDMYYNPKILASYRVPDNRHYGAYAYYGEIFDSIKEIMSEGSASSSKDRCKRALRNNAYRAMLYALRSDNEPIEPVLDMINRNVDDVPVRAVSGLLRRKTIYGALKMLLG